MLNIDLSPAVMRELAKGKLASGAKDDVLISASEAGTPVKKKTSLDNQEAVCKLENTIFQTTGHNLVTNEKKELATNG